MTTIATFQSCTRLKVATTGAQSNPESKGLKLTQATINAATYGYTYGVDNACVLKTQKLRVGASDKPGAVQFGALDDDNAKETAVVI